MLYNYTLYSTPHFFAVTLRPTPQHSVSSVDAVECARLRKPSSRCYKQYGPRHLGCCIHRLPVSPRSMRWPLTKAGIRPTYSVTAVWIWCRAERNNKWPHLFFDLFDRPTNKLWLYYLSIGYQNDPQKIVSVHRQKNKWWKSDKTDFFSVNWTARKLWLGSNKIVTNWLNCHLLTPEWTPLWSDTWVNDTVFRY